MNQVNTEAIQIPQMSQSEIVALTLYSFIIRDRVTEPHGVAELLQKYPHLSKKYPRASPRVVSRFLAKIVTKYEELSTPVRCYHIRIDSHNIWKQYCMGYMPKSASIFA